MTSPYPTRRTGLGRRVADIVSWAHPETEAVDGGGGLLSGPDVVPLEAVPVAMLVADGTGRVRAFNQRWLQVSGLTREETIGSGWLAALPAGDRTSLQAAIDQVAAGGPPRRLEYRWGPDGAGSAAWSLQSLARAGDTLVGIVVDVRPPAPRPARSAPARSAPARSVAARSAPARSVAVPAPLPALVPDPVQAEVVELLRSVDALLATLDRVAARIPVLELDLQPA